MQVQSKETQIAFNAVSLTAAGLWTQPSLNKMPSHILQMS